MPQTISFQNQEDMIYNDINAAMEILHTKTLIFKGLMGV